MNEPLPDSVPSEDQLESLLASQAPVPGPEVDARIQRLGHAALRAAHSSAPMTQLESALCSALIACYATYAVSQIVIILQRV